MSTIYPYIIFPDCLKMARVDPIYKEGDRSTVSNYRPISMLPIRGKIYEKEAYTQQYYYLEHHNQFGFRSKKSKTNAIISQLNYPHQTLDSGKIVFYIFLDFKKAFDFVSHNILLSKLCHYGIRGIPYKWFASYLQNRKQYVNINHSNSSLLSIQYEVPQGSILGPLNSLSSLYL